MFENKSDVLRDEEFENLLSWTEEELERANKNRKEVLLEIKKKIGSFSAEERIARNLYLRRLSLDKRPIVCIEGYDYPEDALQDINVGNTLKMDILVDGKLEYANGMIVTKDIFERIEKLLKISNISYDNVTNVSESFDYSKVNAPIQGPPIGFTSVDVPSLKFYSDEQIEEKAPRSSVYSYLYNNNKDHLDDIAFDYLSENVTYGEFFDNILKAAKAFKKMGVKKGDIVTICSITTPQIVYSFYALNMLGAVSNIIDVRYPEKAIEQFLNEVDSKYCVILDLCYPNVKNIIDKTKVEKVITVSPVESEPKFTKLLYNLKMRKNNREIKKANSNKYVSWDEFVKMGDSETVKEEPYMKDAPAAIIHTGGTTGVPKGVLLSNKNINNVVVQIKNANVKTERGFKFLNIMPPFIAYGLSLGLVTPMVLGWRTRIVPKFDANRFDKLIKKYKPNGFMGVHTYFDSVMSSKKLRKADLSFIKVVLFGGMKVPSEYKKRINDFLKSHNSSAESYEGYSLTENNSAATKTVDGDDKLDSAGIPLVKTRIAAFEPGTTCELPPNVEGELCIQSPTMMVGYYGHEEATRDVKIMHDDGYWIHTGDVGYTDSDGRVFVTDRIKRLFPRSGFKVYPSRIEDLFLSNPAIEKCSVIRMDDPVDGNAPWAVIVLKEGYKGQEENIKAELLNKFNNSDLPPYFEPYKFIFTDDLLYTGIGKVDFKALEEFLSTNHIEGFPDNSVGYVSIKEHGKTLIRHK